MQISNKVSINFRNAITRKKKLFEMRMNNERSEFFFCIGNPFSENNGLKLPEGLLGSSSLVDLQHVETNCLGQWPALANGNNIIESNVPVLGRGISKKSTVIRFQH